MAGLYKSPTSPPPAAQFAEVKLISKLVDRVDRLVMAVDPA
jgi:hypothetical protein